MNTRLLLGVVVLAHGGVLAAIQIDGGRRAFNSRVGDFVSETPLLVETAMTLGDEDGAKCEVLPDFGAPEIALAAPSISPTSASSVITAVVPLSVRRPAMETGERSGGEIAPRRAGKSKARGGGFGEGGGHSSRAVGGSGLVCIHRPPPHYPNNSRTRGEVGMVLLRAWVNVAGAVQRVEILRGSGYSALDGAAHKAVQGWRFQSFPQLGGPRAVEIPIRFTLE